MNGHGGTLWLLIGLCFMNVASSLGSAQNQSAQVAKGTLPNRSQALKDLEKRLQDVTEELASIREQMNGTQSAESQDMTWERADRVERELQDLKREIDALKEQDRIGWTARLAANYGCCESIETNTGNGHMQMENTDQCKRVDIQTAKIELQSMRGKCATEGRIIQSQRRKDLTIDLANDRGQLSKGQNEFCIEFRGALDNRPADPGKVQAEATMEVRRVKAIRAVVRLSQADVGRYCAHVDFPWPGSWAIEVEHKGPSGKEKAVFLATVN